MAVKQTPTHDEHNPDLLAQMPVNARMVVEVGCSSGALAREYKRINPRCRYVGVEVEAEYAKLASRYCDQVVEADIEQASETDLDLLSKADCWVFGDTLEHLRNPWLLLSQIRKTIPADGCVVACIPNAQHWSIQVRLNCGQFRYEDTGLLDRTHLRWFTKTTIAEMFADAGFTITCAVQRTFEEPDHERFLPAIRSMATAIGIDPEVAVGDALPWQYVIRAAPG
jgi:SAM-dependent methyltransferase